MEEELQTGHHRAEGCAEGGDNGRGAEGARGQGSKASCDVSPGAWELSLPGPTSGLTSTVFKEVMAQALCLPSLACSSTVNQAVG